MADRPRAGGPPPEGLPTERSVPPVRPYPEVPTSEAPAPQGEAPVRVYNGRYALQRPLARGGMAEVFLARDQLLDRPVALKVLFPELSVDRSFVERFRREAQAAANLAHPNIVSIYDWGEEEGTYFIVMEYVDGRALSAVVRAEAPLEPRRAAGIVADVAAALAFAHRHGVVHRDVKPGNVLLDPSGHVKVTDFGIARAANAAENLTQTGAVMGTATYFSPEQAQGVPVDQRSDVYSLGVVLYEMLAGRPPFSGDNPVSIAYKHVREAPPALSSLNPAVPADLEAIVAKALAKEPADRYQTAEDARADLLAFAAGRPVSVAPGATRIAPAPTVVRTTYAEPAATRVAPAAAVAPEPTAVAVAEPPRRRGAYAYLALLLAMLVALGGLLYLLGRQLGYFGAADAPAEVRVPRDLVGLTYEQAETRLREVGLSATRREVRVTEVEVGRVASTYPIADFPIPDPSVPVLVNVNVGPPPANVPSVVGLDEDDARRTLEEAGFTVAEPPTVQADPAVPSGRVISQDPSGGTAEPGSPVRLVVSSGPARATTRPTTATTRVARVTVPAVVGQDRDAASNALASAGLRFRTTFEPSANAEVGRVVRTDPPAGSTVERGTTVTIVVATSPTTTTTAPTTTTSAPTTTSTTTPPTTTPPTTGAAGASTTTTS